MKHTLTSKAAELMRKNGKHRRWRRAFSGMAAVVVFITTYMLILPAITMENQAICGMAEHTHTDACYEMQLVCTQEETPEGADVHVHGPECYEQQQVLTCTQQEGEGHAHSDACYGYACGQEESAGHTHTDACYTEVTHRELTCTEPESAGHSHGEGCYDADGNLVCTEAESTGHTHGDSCYTETVTRELTCGQEESSGHTHTDACIGLICGQEEYEGHTHTDACYTTEDVLVCTEPTGHTHGDGCYEKVLVCDVPEHTHTEECYAPVEIPEEETPTTAFPEEIPEGYVEYTFDNEAGLTVTAYAPEGAFGQDVQLFAEVLPEDSEEYAQAKENLDKAENAPEYTGMAAMDIRFVDAAAEDPAQAEEIEPDAEMGQVFVKIDAQALIPEDVDESTLAVQHHVETESDKIFGVIPDFIHPETVTVETVADISEETGDITAVPGETALPEALPALADEPEMAEAATLEEPAAENEEPQPVVMNVEAEFAVNSFSTFTITWKKNNISMMVQIVGEDGQSIGENVSLGSRNIDENTLLSSIAPNVDGYKFLHAEVENKYWENTVIQRLRYNSQYGGFWEYSTDASVNNWKWLYNGDVRFVYGIDENWGTVPTVDDKNIKINLFDIQKSYDGSLLFVSKGEDGTSGYNKYQGASVYQGIVSSVLNGDDIPTKKDGYGTSLADIFTEKGSGVVKAYTGLTGLFQKDQKGYYYFDSSKNFATIAAKDENGTWKIPQNVTSFTVYDQASKFYDNFYKDKNVYFLPFNGYEGVISSGSMLPTDSTGMETNYHFGMTVEFSFAMPENGLMDGEPMIFNFTGDDDVWVFIDDVLVLDMGGMHDAVSGSINFADGTVKVDSVANSAGNIGASSDLGTIFRNAGRTWNNASYKEHTLKFFYLERGAGASNCKITFNMPPVPNNALWVGKELTVPEEASKNLQDYMNNLEFSYKVYKSNNELLVKPNDSYDIYNADLKRVGSGTVGADGVFKVKPGQYAVFPELCPVNADYTYYVEELITDEFNGQYLGVDYTITGDGGDSTSITGDDSSTNGFVGYKTGALNPADEQNRVVFQNKVNVESLSTLDITKILTGGDPLNDKFIFEVKTGDELLPVGTSYQVLRSGGDWNTTGDVTTKSISEQDGAGHITLKAGETARLLVLSGTAYSVEEVNTEENWKVAYSQTLNNAACDDKDNSAAGIQGTVSALHCSVVVTVQNELPVIYGSLSLQKLVDYMGDKSYTTDDTFTFYLTYSDLVENTEFPVTYVPANEGSNNVLTSKRITENGTSKVVLEVTLKQNQIATIGNLPLTAVTITEPNHDGYSVKWEVNGEIQPASYAFATITAGTLIEVTCTNTTGAVLPSTGGMGTTPFLALGTLLTLGAGMLLVQRRRKEGSDAV